MRNNEKHIFLKRSFAFSLIKLFLLIIVVTRLAFLQIFQASHYSLLSDKNRLVVNQILPKRGKILDEKERLLAGAKFSYSAILDLLEIPKEKSSEIIDKLIRLNLINEKSIDELKNLPEKIDKNNRFILLQESLDWESLSAYYIASSTIPGIIIEKNQVRFYTYPDEFSHILGYTNSPTKKDIQNLNNTALSLPTAKIGKMELEKKYDFELFGKSGIQTIEVNSRRQFIRTVNKIDSIPGNDIKLTINLNLQLEVYKLLSQYESGSCVVIDVNTGAILAFASYPGYDPNIFSKKIEKEKLDEIYNNPYKPIINKTINGLYAPGSAFKMITGLAGLNSGVINENTRFNCSGYIELGNHKFHCWKWKYGGHGSVNLKEALSESCDVYFYNVAKMLDPDIIAKTAMDFGLGKKTNIDLPNEKSGLIPTKDWKKKVKKQSWTKGDTINMSIGQGFVLTTPLQLAKMTAILCNGLKPITPHLNKNNTIKNEEVLNYNKKHVNIVLEGMYDAVNSSKGTARAHSTKDKDFEISGKTGSSQVFRISEKQRKLGKTVSDDYWKKEHAVFVGYAPFDNPKFAVCVLIEHGGSGAKTAASVAKEVLLSTKKYCEN